MTDDQVTKDSDPRTWAEQEVERILNESKCKLTIEEVVHDGKLVGRSVIVTTQNWAQE